MRKCAQGVYAQKPGVYAQRWGVYAQKWGVAVPGAIINCLQSSYPTQPASPPPCLLIAKVLDSIKCKSNPSSFRR